MMKLDNVNKHDYTLAPTLSKHPNAQIAQSKAYDIRTVRYPSSSNKQYSLVSYPANAYAPPALPVVVALLG